MLIALLAPTKFHCDILNLNCDVDNIAMYCDLSALKAFCTIFKHFAATQILNFKLLFQLLLPLAF